MASTPVQATSRARAPSRRQRSPSRLPLAVAVIVAIVLGGGYLLARETSLFAVRSFDIAGAPADLTRSLEAGLGRFAGRSLVGLSLDEVERAVESVPTVRSATVERDFPHSLRIVVRPEQAVAIVRRDGDAWLVASSGRVLQQLEPGILRPVPRVWIPTGTGDIAPGDVLLPEQGAAAVSALAQVPTDFPFEIESARGADDSLVLVLANKTELRLGEATEIRTKLASAAAVLESLAESESGELAYLDVSLPTRPVGAPKSQVETSA